jgi:hypothetical protein
MTENKAATYRKMLAYLSDLGADLAGHDRAALARTGSVTIDEMDTTDLLHYQRVLEATIDNRSDGLMDTGAMKIELAAIVRERIARGGVEDKVSEAREFRSRVASF